MEYSGILVLITVIIWPNCYLLQRCSEVRAQPGTMGVIIVFNAAITLMEGKLCLCLSTSNYTITCKFCGPELLMITQRHYRSIKLTHWRTFFPFSWVTFGVRDTSQQVQFLLLILWNWFEIPFFIYNNDVIVMCSVISKCKQSCLIEHLALAAS